MSANHPKLLIVGVGNVLHGDDGFGDAVGAQDSCARNDLSAEQQNKRRRQQRF